MNRLLAAALGAGAGGVAGAAAAALPAERRARWARTNYAGREVSLLGGAAAAGATVATLVATGTRAGGAGALAAAAGGVFGVVDDLDPAPTRAKGLRGHLGALARGEVTTGALKIAGIGAGALLAAATLPRPGARPLARVVDVALDGALIAGTANLLNLFDLRPGRALKVGLGGGTLVALAGGPGAPAAAGLAGVCLAALPTDLAERTMLGDTGANAVGAALGTALAAGSRTRRAAALAGVVGLTLASERVSFTAVIEGNPVLRRLDRWGTRAR
ncbi:hypothetical protein [Georgenia faecalis]|uniref:UDP-N-acetylmuramyl pentapeptide phosphotransferase/UDP-N-acetylglucosamine-1-phosphate transferase n=1 Tax=Georgenia faecalis TaxID=2483799 RepID=A0ABV9DCN3_9MICO|nr:hypothetical protein [Georgenia faecalis]